ncbi:MAG: MFS transporter [Bacteroides sp.]|nr:MFS transporter [Bacteroides sp.]MCM1456750.1 MFS transporter [Lachnoclostridium sp.]
MNIIDFFKVSEPRELLKAHDGRFKRLQWTTFLAATVGYALYYVCRLSLNVVKKPIVDEGIFSETELGIIGSVLFFTYAVGKFCNGFLSDRSNIRRFMSAGLLLSAVVNLCLGFTNSFVLFIALWAVNGWAQSMGAAPCVVALSRWFSDKDRGSVYGFWSASHNLGEAFTFIAVASLVSFAGWRYGFFGAAAIGIIGVIIIYGFVSDTPESQGYRGVESGRQEQTQKTESVSDAQKIVLRMPAIWILAFASAFMYISRYAVNSWGVFFLQAQKGYDTVDAGFIISISSVCGIAGTVLSGVMSDKIFKGNRNIPALIFGLLNVTALSLFLLYPGHEFWIDAAAMVMFGLGIGVLICFLGGLMAIDLAPKKASGAALGVVGIASYIGAALQDVMNGVLIENTKTVVNGADVYNFTYVSYFWIGAALISVLLTLCVWKAKRY